MYTPKRNVSRMEDSLVGSPFRSLNASFGPDQSINEYSRKTPAGKSTFQVIEQDVTHQLLTYGNALPVEVAEVLASQNVISGKIHPTGWASVVFKRKLFVWRYTARSVRKAVNCIELQLPVTELTHKADLTCIMENQSSDPMQALNAKTSIMIVSAEGTVRYWQNVNRPAIVVESNLNLHGKQCHNLLSVMPFGCILTTTTNEVYLLSPTASSIHCHKLTISSGMFSNIGRRVSSFWSQPVTSDDKYLPCTCSATVDLQYSERAFFVAVNENLQKWELTGSSESECKMLFETDLTKCLKNYHGTLPISLNDIDSVQVIDMKNTGFGTIMLLALWRDETFQCVLATLKSHAKDIQVSFSKIVLLEEHIQVEDLLDLKLTLPVADYHAYISTRYMIFSQSVSNNKWEPVKIDFNNAQNTLLGVGSCGNEPVFLSRRHGLITLRITHNPNIMLYEEESKVKETTLRADEFDNEHLSLDTKDCYTTLKSGFISHSKDNQNITGLMSSLECTSQDIHDAVLQLSRELLNSCPATDATWAAQRNIGLVTSSVLLLNQLNDKEQIHEAYIEFLYKADVWKKANEQLDEIQFQLNENGEKLQSMVALLNMYPSSGQMIDNVIDVLEIDMSLSTEGTYLSKKDVFFTNVCDVGEFFSTLLRIEEKKLSELATLKEQIDLISTVSNLFATCYTAAWQYRQSVQKQRQNIEALFVPWTGSHTGVNNRRLLKCQIQLELEQALPNVDSTKVGSILTQQVILLADLLLDGYECHVSLLQSTTQQEYENVSEEYKQQRQYIILSLVHLGYYEEATTLAEKYEDFTSLIIICEKTKDNDKLEHYKTLFQTQGFSNVLYQWYMQKGDWGKLMSEDKQSREFDKFLTDHNKLSWLHFLGTKQFSQASNVLKHLSAEEKVYASRKKMMLVLANLAMLASDETPTVMESRVNDIDKEIELLEYQDSIMEFLGNESFGMQPVTANELIKLCLDDEIEHVGEEQFMILLELLHHVHMEKDLVLNVWNKSIQQDSWDDCPQLDYITVVSEKLFFKCLKYCHSNVIHHELIPAVSELLSRVSASNNSLVQQIKACYEILGI